MRQLSFKGFLSAYLRELSGQESLSISKLALMAKEEMPRLREPLFLYAAICMTSTLYLLVVIGKRCRKTT